MLKRSSFTEWIGLSTLGLSKNEGSASLENFTSSSLALGTFKPQCDLFGLLGFLSEDRLSLTTESLLLGLVSPSSLSHFANLASLVLSHLVNFVNLALLTVRVLSLGSVHLQKSMRQMLDSHNGASAPTPCV